MALSKSEANKVAVDATAEGKSKCLTVEVAGEVRKSDEGASSEYVV